MMAGPVNMVVLAAADNVGVAVRDIAAGERARDIHGHALAAREAIPQGHKIALRTILAKQEILRLGLPVGLATATIAEGQLVHVHNVASQYLTNDEDHYE